MTTRPRVRGICNSGGGDGGCGGGVGSGSNGDGIDESSSGSTSTEHIDWLKFKEPHREGVEVVGQ